MNEFYLINSYIPLLDSAQLLSGSQGIVYFKLYGTEPVGPAAFAPNTDVEADMNIDSGMTIELPPPAGGENPYPAQQPLPDNNPYPAQQPLPSPVGSAAESALAPIGQTPIGGGSGY